MSKGGKRRACRRELGTASRRGWLLHEAGSGHKAGSRVWTASTARPGSPDLAAWMVGSHRRFPGQNRPPTSIGFQGQSCVLVQCLWDFLSLSPRFLMRLPAAPLFSLPCHLLIPLPKKEVPNTCLITSHLPETVYWLPSPME